MLMLRLDRVVEELARPPGSFVDLSYLAGAAPELTTVAPRAGIKRAESGGLRNIDDESDADPIHSFGGSDLCDARYEAFV